MGPRWRSLNGRSGSGDGCYMIENWLEGRMQNEWMKHKQDEMCAMVGVELGKEIRELSGYTGSKHRVNIQV